MTGTPERANASTFLPSVLSTYARNDNQGGRRRTAELRRQSDDNSRIDRDASVASAGAKRNRLFTFAARNRSFFGARYAGLSRRVLAHCL